MHLALETLSPPIQAMLDGLEAVHDQAQDVGRYVEELPAGVDWTRSTHPVVVRHPETGRKLLNVNRAFTTRIEGLSKLESTRLLELLHDHVAGSLAIQCRVQWEPDTLVFWDNRCTQHHAVWDYFPETRIGERVTIAGTARPAA